jgi:MFS transporter, MHS family, shikimate and dehydroshikimate transport protein
MTATADAVSVSPQDVRRVVVASVIGATIEWYDFFLYGVVAGIVLNKLYFPAGDEVVSTMLAYTTFAIGFVARPLGGVLFGHFGDKIGRKSMLVLTLMIMGIATVLIGLLPTYEQIGIAAPLLLLLLRVLQGIGLGGEWGGAVLMAYEYAPKHRRALYASLPQIGLSIGLCLSAGVVAIMSGLPEEDFLSWGWRAGFVASFLLVAVGLYIRLRIVETPAFTRVKARGAEASIPFVEMMRRYPKNIVLGMGARYIDGVFFNIFAVFSIGYLANTVKMPRTEALWSVSVAAFVMIFFIPLFGRFADGFGTAKTYAIGSLLLALVTFPAFWLMSSGSEAAVLIALIVAFGIIYAICYGPEAALFSDLFDTRVRYTGISFVYQFSGIFASGITPIIATWLIARNGGQPWLVCAYVVFAALVSMASAIAIGRQRLPQD